MRFAEYSSLTKDSFVAYRFGQELTKEAVDAVENLGIRRYLLPLPKAVLKKIQYGAIKSIHTPGKLKKLITSILS